jgi:hypothetical protein
MILDRNINKIITIPVKLHLFKRVAIRSKRLGHRDP